MVSREDALRLRGVSKNYGPVKALAGVDLTVRNGEFVVLLGPNGAGKSTLFQILSGLFVPDAGEVLVGGFDMRRDPISALKRLGIVFQQSTLDLELSVYANLMFHARLHGLPGSVARERIASEMERFGIAGLARETTRKLSGGNRRRVELARALIHRPSFLLMDEATVGLDPPSRRDLLAHVARLRDEGQVGLLWSTHLVDEASEADRVVVLHRGRVLFDGTPREMTAAAGEAEFGDAFMAMLASPPEAGAREPAGVAP
ncbi:ATP-binding cassette domain-containing protein [Alsobacter sp. SYSU M60028]|uniref:ATP-binding cassette domain-containing protein n=1 Tax=Alsobacter ponti TaxID=2962936 RepID=A0ABT1LDP4_9HYPH|nr:ABC transporter ATP-binding protein [Alsobacter ponti]MCP8939631.1 ATP-binding cassette domain-containing protein [Alsobacter ponti]